MTAEELLREYKSLSYVDTIKFDMYYASHQEKVKRELENMKLPERLELSPETAAEIHGQNAAQYHDLRGVKFTEADIKDTTRLERMIEVEANQIFNSSTGNGGRDLDTIKFCVKQGKIAELWLIENRGYEEANKKYHDLIDKNGDYTEVKAYDVTSMFAPFIQKDLKKLRTSEWNISKWYIVFKCTYGEYEFLDKVFIK